MQGHVVEDFECQTEEVKHDAISTVIQEKNVYKMSLIPSTVLYFGTYIVTVGMPLVPIGLESSECNSVMV